MKSMTGFGEADVRGRIGRCIIQMQGLNSKYSKLVVNIPREIAFLEPLARAYLQRRAGRGQVALSLSFTPRGGGLERAVLDRRACRDLAVQLKHIRKWLGLPGAPDLLTLVNTGAVVRKEVAEMPRKPLWALVRKGLAAACADLARSKEREGEVIRRDFLKRWKLADSKACVIERLRAGSAKRHEERLRGKVRRLLKGAGYDEGRLLAEVSMYADRVDITEELVRFRSHLEHFGKLIGEAGDTGKKLDFTVQEMMREINTAANKANDARISRVAIEIKAELEKVREQVQNVQ